jgi:hypothetical protein
MADRDTRPLQPPGIYLVRMTVFVILVGFLAFILQKQIWAAFMANPGLNGLILGILLIGIILAVRQVLRLYGEVRWLNERTRQPDGIVSRHPVVLAPLAVVMGPRGSRPILPLNVTRTILDSIAARLDEGREILRYLGGLLILLGLLGTFWGLIDTLSAIGRVIQSMRAGGGDPAVLFEELKSGLAVPLSGIGLSFSASLFGLAGSVVIGFLDLQAGQAQNRFYNELENWLAVTTDIEPAGSARSDQAADLAAALMRLTAAVNEGAGGRAATQAMGNLAEGVQGLVQHMRAEQQMIRDWVEAQAGRERELKQVLDRLGRERVG